MQRALGAHFGENGLPAVFCIDVAATDVVFVRMERRVFRMQFQMPQQRLIRCWRSTEISLFGCLRCHHYPLYPSAPFAGVGLRDILRLPTSMSIVGFDLRPIVCRSGALERQKTAPNPMPPALFPARTRARFHDFLTEQGGTRFHEYADP